MSFGNFGFSEILIIAVMVLIFFGPRRMPEIGRAVGGALREFRRGLNEIQRELQEAERAAKIDPDTPAAKTGFAAANSAAGSTSDAKTDSPPADSTGETPPKPSNTESSMGVPPTPLAAALASPSEPRKAEQPEGDPTNESVDSASQELEEEEGSERAGREPA